MNALRLIDGVMSDDSDALMFGARMVIRKYVSLRLARCLRS